MTTKLRPLLDAQDILNAIRLANLIELAAETLDETESAAISMGTNAIIAEIKKAREILVELVKGH